MRCFRSLPLRPFPAAWPPWTSTPSTTRTKATSRCPRACRNLPSRRTHVRARGARSRLERQGIFGQDTRTLSRSRTRARSPLDVSMPHSLRWLSCRRGRVALDVPGRRETSFRAWVKCLAALIVSLSACAPTFEFRTCRATRRPCGIQAEIELPDGTTGEPRAIPPPGARATVVEFWAIQCEPCRRALRALDAHRGELQQAGVGVVRVAVLHRGDPIEPVREAYGSLGLTGTFLVDWGADYARDLKVRSVPATVVLDREGRVQWLASGNSNAEEIAQAALAVAERAWSRGNSSSTDRRSSR